MSKPARHALAVAATLSALIALPAIASADTFCVNAAAGCSGPSVSSLKAGLASAANNGAGTRDTIMLPAGTFAYDGLAIDRRSPIHREPREGRRVRRGRS